MLATRAGPTVRQVSLPRRDCAALSLWLCRKTPCLSCMRAHRRCTYVLSGIAASDDADAASAKRSALEPEGSTASDILDRLLGYHGNAGSTAASAPTEPSETHNDLGWAALCSHVRGMDSDSGDAEVKDAQDAEVKDAEVKDAQHAEAKDAQDAEVKDAPDSEEHETAAAGRE